MPEEPSAQLHLFQMGGYSYQLLVTNLPTLRIGLPYVADFLETLRRIRRLRSPLQVK